MGMSFRSIEDIMGYNIYNLIELKISSVFGIGVRSRKYAEDMS